MTLQADSAGFLIGGQPINPTHPEMVILERLRDDVRAIRKLLEGKNKSEVRRKNAANDPSGEDGGATVAAVNPATPRLTSNAALTKSLAVADLGRASISHGAIKPIEVKVVQSVATPKRAAPERQAIDRSMPIRDSSGRFVAQAKPAKPELSKPAKTIKTIKTEPVAGERDANGRFTGGGKEQDTSGSKVRDLLGDIKDKIGNAVDLSGSEEVDPNIKAAQEIAGVAGGALNGIKAVGGMLGGALGEVATPMLSGAKGLFKPKANDAPTPWFKRFFNELRGLRREESVFNKAQLRTLKEIEAKPGEGKGGGFMGMLMMLAGPLIAAIGAALTAGFGLLMKVPGMGLLAKLGTALMPAALMPKKPITQPSTVPGGAAGLPGAQPGGAQKKPTLWERAKSKVSGWTGAPEGAPAVPVGAAGTATEAVAKKPGLLARAGKGLGGALKRVPLLGSLLAAVSIGTDVYSSESDDKTTRAEKDKTTGKAIGGGGGAIAGMMAGGAAGAAIGALGGPIGIAIGGVIGSVAGGFFGEQAGAIMGEKVGGWVTDVRNADIPGMIGRTWTKTTDAMGSAWSETTKWFKGEWESALSLFGGIWDKAKTVFDDLSAGVTNLLGKFGIDLPAIKQKAADLAAAAAQKAKDVGGVISGAAGQAGEALKNSAMGRGASVISGKLSEGWSAAKGYLVGASKKADVDPGIVAKIAAFESGFNANASPVQKDGTKISSAHGYGQFLDGTWTDMLNKHGAKYGVAGAGKLTKSDAEKLRGDKNLQAAMLAESTKENVEKGRKFGGKDDDANAYAFHNLGEGDAKKLLQGMNAGLNVRESLMQGATTEKDRARVEAVISGNKSLYGDGTITAAAAYGRMGDVMRRGEVFAQDARATTNAAPVLPAVPVSSAVVTAGARAIPQMPSVAVEPPKVPDIQQVNQGSDGAIGGGQEQRPSVIVVGNKTPVGRDLSNRPLAHIVTGGLSGA